MATESQIKFFTGTTSELARYTAGKINYIAYDTQKKQLSWNINGHSFSLLPTADWSITDPTHPGYIANKPTFELTEAGVQNLIGAYIESLELGPMATLPTTPMAITEISVDTNNKTYMYNTGLTISPKWLLTSSALYSIQPQSLRCDNGIYSVQLSRYMVYQNVQAVPLSQPYWKLCFI